jgi:hypothetical protein
MFSLPGGGLVAVLEEARGCSSGSTHTSYSHQHTAGAVYLRGIKPDGSPGWGPVPVDVTSLPAGDCLREAEAELRAWLIVSAVVVVATTVVVVIGLLAFRRPRR